MTLVREWDLGLTLTSRQCTIHLPVVQLFAYVICLPVAALLPIYNSDKHLHASEEAYDNY